MRHAARFLNGSTRVVAEKVLEVSPPSRRLRRRAPDILGEGIRVRNCARHRRPPLSITIRLSPHFDERRLIWSESRFRYHLIPSRFDPSGLIGQCTVAIRTIPSRTSGWYSGNSSRLRPTLEPSDRAMAFFVTTTTSKRFGDSIKRARVVFQRSRRV